MAAGVMSSNVLWVSFATRNESKAKVKSFLSIWFSFEK